MLVCAFAGKELAPLVCFEAELLFRVSLAALGLCFAARRLICSPRTVQAGHKTNKQTNIKSQLAERSTREQTLASFACHWTEAELSQNCLEVARRSLVAHSKQTRASNKLRMRRYATQLSSTQLNAALCYATYATDWLELVAS